MKNELKKNHPNFEGNWKDLDQFMQLVESPIRTPKRAKALAQWSEYQKERQLSWPGAYDQDGMLTKDGYIESLTAQIIDLRGAKLDNIVLGYVNLRGVLFDKASLRGAWLKGANLENASLKKWTVPLP